ncbi:MAG: hypothetical protein NTU44_08340 [Bacteroidetes bacterium]|nr:hypothetical protein [Bacteroidota bacterium]
MCFFQPNEGFFQPVFDTWVFSPGFPHFSIDSVRITQSGTGYDAGVFVRQRSKGTTHIGNDNILEIGFADQHRHFVYDTIHFSGSTGYKRFHLETYPALVTPDPNERIEDATTDYLLCVSSPGVKEFPYTYCSLEVSSSPDTSLIRITHHWVAPDPLIPAVPGFTLSPSRYWQVEGIIQPGFSASLKFSYSSFNYLDNELITDKDDSLVVVYRPSCAYPWHDIPFTQNGMNQQGELIVDSFRTGEYALGIWDHNYLSTKGKGRQKDIRKLTNPPE